MSRQYDSSLLAGAQGHLHDFLRSIQIGLEFFRGFRLLRNLGPTVTVFGSARFSEDHPACVQARAVGTELARAGFTVTDGVTLLRAGMRFACIDLASGRPRRMPKEFLDGYGPAVLSEIVT